MNGVHDLGGMHGMGPVEIERNEPVFHARWEARAFALTVACGALGRWNIDMSRRARERMPAAQYLASTYYEKWLHGLETLLVETGLVTQEEQSSGRAAGKAAGPRQLAPGGVADYLRARIRARLDDDVAQRFRTGDAVTARNLHPAGHTRLPRYVRGRRGEIHRDHGVFIFPDTHAVSRERKPQHLYSVRFAARELWGPAAAARDAVHLDLWDDYLDPAPR